MAVLEVNDRIWSSIYSSMALVTDNIAVILLLIAIFAGEILSLARSHYSKKYLFGIPELGIAISARYAIYRTPVIHQRIHFALSFVADMIQSHENYMNAFIKVSSLSGDLTQGKIASFLYHAEESQKDTLLHTSPAEVYKHLYITIRKVMAPPILGNLSVNPFKNGWISVLGCMVLLSIIFFIMLRKGEKKNSVLSACVLVGAVTYGMITCTGVILLTFYIITIEAIATKAFEQAKEKKKHHIKSDVQKVQKE